MLYNTFCHRHKQEPEHILEINIKIAFYFFEFGTSFAIV